MNTRTITLVIAILIVTLLASACGGSAGSQATDAAQTEAAGGSLSQAAKLALGILKLEDTAQAVTLEQAEALLTLWQAYQTLGNSETTAAAELEALVNQIESSLTSEQAEAIAGMGLSTESMADVMQGLGMEFGPGAMQGLEGTPVPGSGFEGLQSGQMPEGGFPGGGVPPSGAMGQGGGGMRMQIEGGDMGSVMGAQGTPGAMNQNRFSSLGSQVSPMLLRALIGVLEAKIAAAE